LKIAGVDRLVECRLLSPREVAALTAAGLTTAADLLSYFPKRHEDRRQFERFPTQGAAYPTCLRGTVSDARNRNFGGGKGYYEVEVSDSPGGVFSSGKVTCRWFNMPFMSKVLAVGHDVILYGKVKDVKGQLIMDHPEIEVVREDGSEESLHLGRIVPVYRNISGISQRRLREMIHLLMTRIDGSSLRFVPASLSMRSKFECFWNVHFPASLEVASATRRIFALEEFFRIQLQVVWRRSRHRSQPGRVLGRRTTLLKQFHQSLPFELTGAQKRSIHEIADDMRKPIPMNRLLQGDVGSGKTFVALAAMLLAVESGCQAALMAPTQILAEQHYLTFCRWLEPLGIRLALRTAASSRRTDLELSGMPQIVIGTHALIHHGVEFEDLGLVVIDEQHKFGVAQRLALARQGKAPDVLVMTATPIPRTLAMTLYGDLDVSILNEKPPGRGKVVTAVRVGAKQADVTRFVKDQIDLGRQAYLVYPLVEESEALAVESAVEAREKWSKRLGRREVGLIHGKLRLEEKEEVMRRFREGTIAALVATTAIEVGVDVPNASVMVLHHAERFGLAQIHQLRGRIGRGGHRGYCVLLTDGKNPDALEKLGILENSADGFEIAEADLRLRGPGDVLGTAQSGVSDLRFGDFLADTELMRAARTLAERVLEEDPELCRSYPELRAVVEGISADTGPV
jgi:ATP-dependent DNA helicase RecG